MNKRRMERLAKAVEQNASHFDMREGFYDTEENDANYRKNKPHFETVKGKKVLVNACNTTCCMAGFAVMLFSDNLDELTEWNAVEKEAQRVLGLTGPAAYDLFNVPLSVDKGTTLLRDDRKEFDNAQDYANAGAEKIRKIVADAS